MRELVKVAKNTFFWEDALQSLLPPERRNNGYARPNYTVFATKEYKAVEKRGWAPVFNAIDALGEKGLTTFLNTLKQLHTNPETGEVKSNRYLSTSFDPFLRLGTVELRRQAGVASATTAIHRVLLALTLRMHASSHLGLRIPSSITDIAV
jgi:hypothetical protein